MHFCQVTYGPPCIKNNTQTSEAGRANSKALLYHTQNDSIQFLAVDG
jgi:hypothetical protein